MMYKFTKSGTDPGFPIVGIDLVVGGGPLTQAHFGENVCENERIGCLWGRVPAASPGSAIVNFQIFYFREQNITCFCT